jgi:hypothetical protein
MPQFFPLRRSLRPRTLSIRALISSARHDALPSYLHIKNRSPLADLHGSSNSMPFRIPALLIWAALVIVMAPACTGQGGESATDEQRRYVADICEPFARYFEGAIALGFPEFEGVDSPEDVTVLFGRLRAISQTAHDDFGAVTPPSDMLATHEQLMEVLETEIEGYQLLEAALASGDQGRLEEALAEADQQATLAGIGPTGFFPTNVPRGYEEAWEEECASRLTQIPGVED